MQDVPNEWRKCVHRHCCRVLSHDASSARLTPDVCFTISRAALVGGTRQGMGQVHCKTALHL